MMKGGEVKRNKWRFEALARAKIVRQEEEAKTITSGKVQCKSDNISLNELACLARQAKINSGECSKRKCEEWWGKRQALEILIARGIDIERYRKSPLRRCIKSH